jgi:phosphatidylethanolamine-binding protein (PEBP) family uncharacterized protein
VEPCRTAPRSLTSAGGGPTSATAAARPRPACRGGCTRWVLYDVPATSTRLPKNVRGVGILGNNSVNGRTGYAPPHSKGPGPKTYVYTVYALSSPVKVDVGPAEVSRDVLLAAMKGLILARAELKVVYAREPGADERGSSPTLR